MMNTIHILLADDDEDDCNFFTDALANLAMDTSLTIVNDGEQLIQHLVKTSANLPHMLFLDLNMPRKNGFESLVEIKRNPLWKSLPVIIYSTSFDREKASLIYRTGAHYYITKPSDFSSLIDVIQRALTRVLENTTQPPQEQFLLTRPKKGYS